MEQTFTRVNRAEHISFWEKLAYFSVTLLILALYAFPDKGFMLIVSIPLFVIVSGICKAKSIRLGYYSAWSSLYLVIAFSSIFWAFNSDYALADAIKIAQVVVVCFFLSLWVDKPEKLIYVFNWIVYSSLLMSVRLLIEVPFEAWGARRFGFLLGLNVNTIAIRITLGSLLLIHLISESNRRVKLLYYPALAFLVLVILLLGSRRSLFIFIIGYFIYNSLSSRNILRYFRSVIISCALAGVVIYMCLNVPELYVIVGSRMERTIIALTRGGQVLDYSRQALIDAGISMFREKPVFGWGLDNYRLVSGMGRYSHNNYVELLASIGLVGFVAYYALHAKLVLFSIKRLWVSKINVLFLSILLAILLSDFAAPSYSSLFIHFFLAIIVAYQENGNKSGLRSNFSN